MRALFALALVACAAPGPGGPAPGSGRLTHTVLIWLAEDAPEGSAGTLAEEFVQVASGFEGLEACTVGRARSSIRPTVDASFDLALTMVFRDEAAEVAWQADPGHRALVERSRDAIARLVVYDALE